MANPVDERLEAAARAIATGDVVVYPTETVYGLGANAVDAESVEAVFACKHRNRDKPLSLAVPTVDAAFDYTRPTDREKRFMRAFLPGPVTVVVERNSNVPDALTGGRDRVGVRVPDHELALAFLRAAETPVTATSANVSGNPSVRRIADLDDRIRDCAAVVLGGGDRPSDGEESPDVAETPERASTVVAPETGEILRRGADADAVEAWLQAE